MGPQVWGACWWARAVVAFEAVVPSGGNPVLSKREKLMNRQRNFRRANVRVVFAALITSLAFYVACSEVRALDTEVAGLVYHPQVTSYYCGSATVEMMLDNTAVRSTNPYVNFILNAPDPVAGSFFNVVPGQ